jgi:hypothetical protein
MCAYKRKSWNDKLNNTRPAQVETADKDFAGIRKGQTMLVPTALMVDAYIRQVPAGQSVDLPTLRRDLAAEAGAEVTCPLTSGIFVRIAAEAAYEQYQNGASLDTITPFWRVISPKSPAAKKLTFGTGFLLEQRSKEGLE